MNDDTINELRAYGTPNQPLSVHLRNLILRRIWLEEYPVGQLLPSIRELAAELGVNRNTVRKVYEELRSEGHILTIHGKGSYVVKRTELSSSFPERNTLLKQIDGLIANAKGAGVDRWELARNINTSINKHYNSQILKVGFIECNKRDTFELSRELSDSISMPVEPIQLNELVNDPDKYLSYNLLITTFFHIQEAEEIHQTIKGDAKIIAIQINPVPEVLLEIARLRPGTTVALVSSNQRTNRGLRNIIQTYNPVLAVRSVVIEDDPNGLNNLEQWADVILDSQSVNEVVSAKFPDLKIVTVHFQIDSKSMDFVRKNVVAMLANISDEPEFADSAWSRNPVYDGGKYLAINK